MELWNKVVEFFNPKLDPEIVNEKTYCGKIVEADLMVCFNEKEAPDGLYIAHPEECDGPEIFLYEKKNNEWLSPIKNDLIVCPAKVISNA